MATNPAPDIQKTIQLADQLRDEIASYIQKDFPGRFISINQVTFNLSKTVAFIWISIYSVGKPDGHDKGLLKQIQNKQGFYQNMLTKRLNRRKLPHIEFKIITPCDILIPE